MNDLNIIPADILASLNRCVTKYNGTPASKKQHAFFVKVLKQYANGEPVQHGPNARTHFIAGDGNGQRFAFVTHRRIQNAITRYTMTPGHADRQRWRQDYNVTPAPGFSEDAKAELRRIIGWGPSALAFSVNDASVKAGLIAHAKLGEDTVNATYTRANKAAAWDATALTDITRIQIAAKGLLCEVGDNAGTSPVAMSADDANYVSQMLVNGHIRNAHYFQMKATGYKGIRGACIVNKAKMDPATQVLAQRMVDLMNAAVQQLGRPVSFSEYTAMAGVAAA